MSVVLRLLGNRDALSNSPQCVREFTEGLSHSEEAVGGCGKIFKLHKWQRENMAVLLLPEQRIKWQS